MNITDEEIDQAIKDIENGMTARFCPETILAILNELKEARVNISKYEKALNLMAGGIG